MINTLFKGLIDNFKPSQRRILISEDTKIPCGTSVILLAHKRLAILDR